MTSCHKEPEMSLTDETQAAIIEQYVNHTIAPTYTNLANYTDQLVKDLKALKAEDNK